MILAAFALPHPPIILPEIGKGREKEIQATIDAFDECAKIIAQLKPDIIVVCSPHKTDSQELDHGVTVPLYFVDKAIQELWRDELGSTAGSLTSDFYTDYDLIPLGIAGYSLQDNYDYGKKITEHPDLSDKRVVFIASGDLSHALTENAPCGFADEGALLDSEITAALADGDWERLMLIPLELAENGKECGLRPLAMMAGVLHGLNITPKLHSYEGTFGVGYAVASFIVES